MINITVPQACRKPEILESRIPARCDICRQFWSFSQTDCHLQTISSYNKNYVTKIVSSRNSRLHSGVSTSLPSPTAYTLSAPDLHPASGAETPTGWELGPPSGLAGAPHPGIQAATPSQHAAPAHSGWGPEPSAGYSTKPGYSTAGNIAIIMINRK